MDDRERSMFISSGLFVGAYLLAFGGLIGLIVTIGVLFAAFWASRGQVAMPTFWHTGAMALSALTVILAVYAAGQYTESITMVVSYLFALAYLINALHVLLPDVVRTVPRALEPKWTVACLLALAGVLGFLSADFTISYVLWICAVWYLWNGAYARGLWAEYAPTQLLATDWRRWLVVGIILCSACLGLVWSQKTDVNPGFWWGFFLNGTIGTPSLQFDFSGHSFGVDILPAVVMAGLVWWMVRPSRTGGPSFGILDKPWLALAAVAVLGVYALSQNPLGEFGPKAFIVCLIPLGIGAYRYYRQPAKAA